ncbi:MAG: transcriptional regulator of aroF, aroG, tyrA and aromatic amino acid transport [Bacillota bacterium]|jgi:transcriptional regulator of aroF, aroG, tyrA and aromatic amino acid transport|nr:transcriptional regulator of aroF, aroG, tyrA and aromatic amino acid transport [Bacillota bacterium]
MNITCWRISAVDRVGITLDVLRVLAGAGINIISLEVFPGVIHVQFSAASGAASRVRSQLLGNEDIKSVETSPGMPFEQRERQVQAVLDTVQEGIVAVDARGVVVSFNPAAERILDRPAATALGRPVGDVLPAAVPVQATLNSGRSFANREIYLHKAGRKLHYLTSGRPILDKAGHVNGAVVTLRDMSEVRDLVYSLTQPALVTFDDIIYRSAAMHRVVEMAKRIAKGTSTVLLRGESGTGKEIFARAIHVGSPRRQRPFVPVNCAALPDTLLESELFGYEEGAFTGARRGGKAGLFEFAHTGTIFLDEIGELTPHLQVKLLRVLQEGKVRRVGGTEERSVDVRVIAATNRNLEAMVAQGDFRDDFYYRLNVIPLYIPPLRERLEDIPPLVDHCLVKFSRRLGKKVTALAPEALARLRAYPWPGNVRELENVIERAINLARDEVIRAEDLLLAPDAAPLSYGPAAPGDLRALRAKVEKEAVYRALQQYGSVRRAAQALGISHTALLRKVHRYGLTGGQGGSSVT